MSMSIFVDASRNVRDLLRAVDAYVCHSLENNVKNGTTKKSVWVLQGSSRDVDCRAKSTIVGPELDDCELLVLSGTTKNACEG